MTLRNHNQKQIIGYLKNYIRNNKKKIDTSNSSICYFHNYGQLPGAATIRLKFFGFNYFFSYLKIFLKNILTVATLKNCKTTKTDQLNYKFKNLFISHVSKSDFNSDGSYKDKYFNINSKNFKNTLFFLNSIDHNLPKKISKNIVIFYNSDKFLKFDLFYFFQILCKEIKSYNFSIKKFLHEFSFLTQFSKIFNKKIISIINKNNFKKIMSFYEAQPYQNYLFKKLQKEKKIKTIGCYHSGLLPLHSSLIYREGTPNKILISGKFQREYLIKNLGWPSRKVFSTTSFRYKKLNRKIYEGYIFLPYTITFEKKILDGIENYFFKSKKGSLRRYKIKNHPHQGDSAVHNKIIKKIKLIMIKYHDRFTNKNKNKNKNSIFIGSTTSIILALDHGVEAVHVCEQPLFDSYNNGIWEPIRAKQLSENVLIYNMKKNRQILQIRNQHDSIKRYLN